MKRPDREQILLTSQIVLPASATWWSSVYGAVSVVNGSVNVAGSGTQFKNLSVGQLISFANQPGVYYTVAAIHSNVNLDLTTPFTGVTNAATAVGTAENPVYHHLGAKRLVGSVYSSVATNTLGVQFSPDGTNWYNTQPLAVDPYPANAGSYTFDLDLNYPFFRFLVTDSGGGSTVQIQATVFEEGSGSSLVGGSSPAAIYVKDTPLVPLGCAQYTTLDATTAKTLAQLATASIGGIPAGATTVAIQVGTGLAGDTSVPCLGADDGTTPTSTVGGLDFLPGVQYVYSVTPLTALKIIGSSAGPTKVRLAFYR